MKKAQVLAQSAQDAHVINGLGLFARPMLHDESKIEGRQRLTKTPDDPAVRVWDAQNAIAVATLRVKDPREVPGLPCAGWRVGPSDQLANPFYFIAALSGDRLHRTHRARRKRKLSS